MWRIVNLFVYFAVVYSANDLLDVPINIVNRNLPDLPTPDKFLEMLLNKTKNEIMQIVSHFTFAEILDEDITFLLYQKDGGVIRLDINSEHHHVNNKEPIKFIIHGWQGSGDHDFIKDFAKAYHSIGIKNVFGVDWSPHSMKNYLHSARGTKKVGEIVGDFIMNVLKNDTSLLKNVHVVGFSLGAQAAGFAGKKVMNLTDGIKVGRITALDAAGPLFEFPIKLPEHLRVQKGDADYIDTIHTNAGFLGFLGAYGDADHYVDYGGPIQPGCTSINVFSAFTCSHSRAYEVFNRTIVSDEYLSTPCQDPVRAIASLCDNNKRMVLGEHTTRKARGDFFIEIDKNFKPQKNRGLKKLLDVVPIIG